MFSEAPFLPAKARQPLVLCHKSVSASDVRCRTNDLFAAVHADFRHKKKQTNNAFEYSQLEALIGFHAPDNMHLLVNLCIFVITAFYVSRFPHCRFTPIFTFSPHSWIMHSPPPSPLFTSFPCHYFALSTFVSPFLSCKLSLARISRLETCSTQPTSGHSVPVPEIPTCSHLVTWSTSSTHHLISLTIYRYISSPGPISRFCQSRFVLYQSQIAISSPLAQDPSVFHLNPRRTSDFKRGDVAGVRLCYCFATVLLLYGTALWCTVVGLLCLLAQYWSCSVCVTPLVQFPLFSALLFVLVEFVSSLNRFTSLKSSNCRLRQ